MSELIIPPSVKANYRPYRTATTQALLYELQQRQILAELNGQIILPDMDTLARSGEATQAMRTEQFNQMASQMGIQLASSGFAFTAVESRPNTVDPDKLEEVLIMSLLVARHPRIAAPKPQQLELL